MESINVLYFFPYEITNKNHGNITRAIQLLEYFTSRPDKISIDFVTQEHKDIENEPSLLKKMFPELNSFFLQRKYSKKNHLKYFIKSKIPSLLDKKKQKKYHTHIKSPTTLFEKQEFNKLLKKKQYDCIIISYVYFAPLIRNNPYVGNAKLIIDTHDFMTALNKKKKSFSLGPAFEEEMKILNEFDNVWAISSDELYLFSQFAAKAEHSFVPVMYENNTKQNKSEILYDLLYVASDNPSNQISAKWFFNKVYPLLSKKVRICVIGRIVNFIPKGLPNVTSILFADNLKQYYLQSRISICPMLQGTGIKVKVVEALSFALPVICTLRGLDGLPQKSNNGCLLAKDEFEFAKQIAELMSDKAFYESVQKRGVEMFEEYFQIKSVYKQLDKILILTELT